MLQSLCTCTQSQTHAFFDRTDDFGRLEFDVLLLASCGDIDALFDMFNTDDNTVYRSTFSHVCEEEAYAITVDVLLRLCLCDGANRVLTHGSFGLKYFLW